MSYAHLKADESYIFQPIHISFSHWYSKAIPPFYDALVKLGVAPTYDAADGEDAGDVWSPPLGIRQDVGRRSYAAVVCLFRFLLWDTYF